MASRELALRSHGSLRASRPAPDASVGGLHYSLGMDSRPIILSIAGYDPSSGAGVTADVKTAAGLGCYAVTCITALTIQSTQGVFGLEPIRPELVRQTLFRLADDVEFGAVRIGMLGPGDVAGVVADFLREAKPPNVVLDPVLRSSSGAGLVDGVGLTILRNQLLPLCDVITPNVEEAKELANSDADDTSFGGSWESVVPRLRGLAAKLHRMGCRAVVITGGHLQETNDFLSVWGSGQTAEQVFQGARLESRATHGTGCAFATAVACGLAHGYTLPKAVEGAKDFVRHAMAAAYPVGKGIGPMNHLFQLSKID